MAFPVVAGSLYCVAASPRGRRNAEERAREERVKREVDSLRLDILDVYDVICPP